MIIQNLKYPFYHTIIYNYFTSTEYEKVFAECEYLTKNIGDENLLDDEHHTKLFKVGKTKSFMLDLIYEGKREESHILQNMKKIFNIDIKENPFSGYVTLSNFDQTVLNEYKEGSRYFKHDDKGILTFLYTIWKEPKTWQGGDLIFNEYDYKPYLRSNCCLIFPSFELHEVEILRGEGIRYSINQMIYIK